MVVGTFRPDENFPIRIEFRTYSTYANEFYLNMAQIVTLMNKHLINSIGFIQDRGYLVYYVEVGYPTSRLKPVIGWCGWGREKDQLTMLKTYYQARKAKDVPWMQICEFIDPDPEKLNYVPFFSELGETPKVLGINVSEELHWGLLRRDGSEKMAYK